MHPRIRNALRLPACAVLLTLSLVSLARGDEVMLVVGAGGTSDYQQAFESWASDWLGTMQTRGDTVRVIGVSSDLAAPHAHDSNREALLAALRSIADRDQEDASPLWLVLLGHGTFGQGVANFNLTGPDISAAELAAAMEPLKRPVILINAASASGPFLQGLSGPDRLVVTATRSGDEQNFARFGGYLATALSDPQADLDHDGRISLLEAYLLGAARTEEFYAQEDRLLTEHALLDDNGDGKGTPSDFFRGTRVAAEAAEGAKADGRWAARLFMTELEPQPELSAAQLARVRELEEQLDALRRRKQELAADEYYRKLEPLLVELAEIERQPPGPAEPPADGAKEAAKTETTAVES